MPEKPLSDRLKIRPGENISVMNSPPGITGLGRKTAAPGFRTGLLSFVRSAGDLNRMLGKIPKNPKPEYLLWISYPKKSSGINSDLDRGVCWSMMKESGFSAVSQISINSDWSAMRFKPSGSVKRKSVESDLVDKTKREVRLPEDLAVRLKKKKGTIDFFHSLSFTHRKEYVIWIESAKKPETREARVKKAVEMLSAGIKCR